jgi:antitoxin VapB
MSLEIRSARADSLARELARATGESVEIAVERAIEERLARIPRPLPKTRQAKIDALFDRLARMPALDGRSPDEIVGYGPDGLPL